MPRIFISYRREDTQDVTGRIYEHLARRFPNDVFRDISSIPLGVDFAQYLAERMNETRVFLPVIGPNWLGAEIDTKRRRIDLPDDFVRLEAEAALAHQIAVVPLLVLGAQMPSKAVLPDCLHRLADRHGLPIRPDPDFESDIERLVQSIRVILGVRSQGAQSVVLRAGAALVLVLVGVLLAHFVPSCRQSGRLEQWLGLAERWSRQGLEHVGSVDRRDGTLTRISSGWIFVGYYDHETRVYVEGPFATVAYRPTGGERGAIPPQVGDVLQIIKERRIIISNYRYDGLAHQLTSPSSFREVLTEDDETGMMFRKNDLVIVRDVETAGALSRPLSVWCRVAPCDTETDQCSKAWQELHQ